MSFISNVSYSPPSSGLLEIFALGIWFLNSIHSCCKPTPGLVEWVWSRKNINDRNRLYVPTYKIKSNIQSQEVIIVRSPVPGTIFSSSRPETAKSQDVIIVRRPVPTAAQKQRKSQDIIIVRRPVPGTIFPSCRPDTAKILYNSN